MRMMLMASEGGGEHGGEGLSGYIAHHLHHLSSKEQQSIFDLSVVHWDTLFFSLLLAAIVLLLLRMAATRATAGVAGATYIFCLPGSPGACRDAWDEILVHQLDYRYRPCNFVEIMPRLDEHLRRGKAKGATV